MPIRLPGVFSTISIANTAAVSYDLPAPAVHGDAAAFGVTQAPTEES